MKLIFYAVQQGKKPGIYLKWKDVQDQIKDFKKPKFRKFNSLEEAKRFAFPKLYKQIEQKDDNQMWIKDDISFGQDLLRENSGLKLRDSDINTVSNNNKILILKDKNVWITCTMERNGIIGVYFSQSDFFTGYYIWEKPISIIRLRIAACIKAVEMLQQSGIRDVNLIGYFIFFDKLKLNLLKSEFGNSLFEQMFTKMVNYLFSFFIHFFGHLRIKI